MDGKQGGADSPREVAPDAPAMESPADPAAHEHVNFDSTAEAHEMAHAKRLETAYASMRKSRVELKSKDRSPGHRRNRSGIPIGHSRTASLQQAALEAELGGRPDGAPGGPAQDDGAEANAGKSPKGDQPTNALPHASKSFFKRQDEPQKRFCYINERARTDEMGYVQNYVRTTKYTWWNIVPKMIFEQFRRVFNAYYLLVVCISFIPGVSPVAPAVNLVPLIVIVGFGMARELYEDIKRARADRQLNNSPVYITPREAGNTEVEQVRTRDIKVGDILYLRKGDLIPADVLVLASSSTEGTVFMSTANLDGETNLKELGAVCKFTNAARRVDDIAGLRGQVTYMLPDPALDVFEGLLTLETGERYPATEKNLALRGARLRNTHFIYGLVLYAGYDTKEALNMRLPPYKFGEIERSLNYIVIGLFISLLIICMAYATAAYFVTASTRSWYLGVGYVDDPGFGEDVDAGTWWKALATFLILYASYVPVALFVTLELIRVAQTIFLGMDIKMFSRGRPARSTASNLNETLAQIDYICSDKTGTLTENEMKFVSCSVNGKIIDLRKDENAIVRLTGYKRREVYGESTVLNGADAKESSPTSPKDERTAVAVRDFVLAMGLCHNVVPEPKDVDDADSALMNIASADASKGKFSSTDSSVRDVEYQGSSPDEVALVTQARGFGVELLARSKYSVELFAFGQQIMYEMLEEIPFNSDRKRMSTVVRDPTDGKIWLYTKGADNIMLELLDPVQTDVIAKAREDVDFFASEGLRTLILARRELSESEYASWASQLEEAKADLEHLKVRVPETEKLIETNLQYLGISAVEDKLQADLGPTIAFLRDAGIKLWVLTGDKRQTAESIGYSSALLDQTMNVQHIEVSSSEEAGEVVRNLLVEMAGDRLEELIARTEQAPKRWWTRAAWKVKRFLLWKRELVRQDAAEQKRAFSRLSIIIDGISLQYMIDDHADEFMDLCDFCKTVICCRVTPKQKAMVVRMIMTLREKVTLAIGDGANDVGMIQEAQIGCGIYGKEGMNAARAADFSFSEFRMLKRLLFVHGHYNYVRTAGMMNLQFYKNVLFVCSQFFYQYYCIFSGQSVYADWYVSTFNVIVTSIPPFIYGVFERDVRASTLESQPMLYRAYRLRPLIGLFTVLEFTVIYGVWHALAVFFVGVFGLSGLVQQSSGLELGWGYFGYALVFACVIIVLVKMLILAHWWNWIYLLSMVVSMGIYFAVPPFFIQVFSDDQLVGVQPQALGSSLLWLYTVLACTVAFFPDFIIYMWNRIAREPTLLDLFQISELKGVSWYLSDFE